MPSLKEDVAVTMSMLEMHMPPSFFDVMSHLVLHLVEELELCGPVHTRWMYSVERMNKVLKGFVNNMARPEACMAKSYVLDEAIGLVAEFMAEEYEPLHRKVWTEEAAAGIIGEVLQGAATTCSYDAAHERYCPRVHAFKPYIVPTSMQVSSQPARKKHSEPFLQNHGHTKFACSHILYSNA